MLIFDRGPSQSIFLSLAEGINASTAVGELFKGGPIRVPVMSVSGTQVRIGVRTSLLFDVYREDGMESLSCGSVAHPISTTATTPSSKRAQVQASL